MSPDTDPPPRPRRRPRSWTRRRLRGRAVGGAQLPAEPARSGRRLGRSRAARRAPGVPRRVAAASARSIDAYRTARLLIPLVAEKGDEGIGAHGLAVDKTQELSIVTVAAPDGRRVLPVFTSVEAMKRWDAAARPVPADGVRTALAAADDDTDLIVHRPRLGHRVRHPPPGGLGDRAGPAVGAELHLARGVRRPAREHRGRARRLDLPSRPATRARLRGPELVVRLELMQGLEKAELDAVLARLAARWAADDRIAVLVDSLTVKLVRA